MGQTADHRYCKSQGAVSAFFIIRSASGVLHIWSETENASYLNEMKLLHLKRRFMNQMAREKEKMEEFYKNLFTPELLNYGRGNIDGALAKKSVIDSSDLKSLLKTALTDKINDREMFMKGIDYSYYYEEDSNELV